ncbi:MAG TPA: hypothetical protein VFT66_21045 [Roseiflexaceae bacterium]|jgi:hypothetical protein|nr:hypothetical protein [Roseiflexaceae bacterium]
MPNDIDQTVDQVLGEGLEHASEADILQRLDAELQQQTSGNAAVLGADAAEPWMRGEAAGGSAAQRFIAFYADAIHKEICDPEKGRLKDEYRGTIGGLNVADQVKSLVPYILTALGIGASFVNPAAIGALVALWLVRVGLDQWCAAPQASMAETTANTGAGPAPIDPSLATSAGAAEGRARGASDPSSDNDLLHDLLDQPTGTGSAPMSVNPSGSTGVANTEPAHATDPKVRIDPATTSSNPDVRGES